MTRSLLALLLMGVALASDAAAQVPVAPAPAEAARLRVYLDCFNCFEDYLRDEIRWVDFVREPQDADVHVFITTTQTGGGGQEYALRFQGVGRLVGTDETLRASSTTGDTEDTRRRTLLRALTIGLLRQASILGVSGDLEISVAGVDLAQQAVVPQADPWNLWVFSLRGSGSLQAEESQRESSWEASVSADRVTDNWRISAGAEIESETEEFDLDEDDPIVSRTQSREADWIVVKSLGEHWSAGLSGSLESSTFSNVALSFDTAPAIEYNVFPYSAYNRRQLRIQYAVGPRYARYNEITLFDKLSEHLVEHELSASLDQRETWGSLSAEVEWSQFFHDLSKNRLEARGDVSLRIARGFSVNLNGDVSRVRDQLSLPRRGVTPEEVLLRLRQLLSGYEVGFSAGLTYSFGSIFNNVVNPRFGR